MRILRFLTLPGSLVLGSALGMAQGAPSTENCEQLAKLEVPNASITATAVPAGGFVGPKQNFTGRDLSDFYKKLPAFCRVVAHAKPSADSDIVIEVWMPMAGWNGKLQGLVSSCIS